MKVEDIFIMFLNRLSSSKSDIIDQCLLKFDYKYLRKLPGFPKINEDQLNFGTYIHKIFELGYTSKHISELKKISEDIKKDFKLPHITEARINKCLDNFFKFNTNMEETIGVEYKFEVELASGITYNGVIDRIVKGKSGGLLVIDYKTGKNEKSRAELARDKQLMGYAFACSKKFDIPIKDISCCHFYPVTNKLVAIKFNNADISNWREKEVNKVWKIRKRTKNQFPPSENNFCNYCEYQLCCPCFNDPATVEIKLLEQEKLKEAKALREVNEKPKDSK